MFRNGLNIGLPLQAWLENRAKKHWLSGKEKVPGVAVSKEGHVNNLLGHERTNDNWFP